MNLLDNTIALFKSFRSSMVTAMINLREIKETEQWRERFTSWGEFVESPDGLGISQGFASKLITTANHYLIQGGISPEKLEGIDYERLYMARALPGSVEEQVEKARVLTRRELKEEKNEEEEHQHEPIQICKTCHIRL
jgi:hypothetical protein